MRMCLDKQHDARYNDLVKMQSAKIVKNRHPGLLS